MSTYTSERVGQTIHPLFDSTAKNPSLLKDIPTGKQYTMVSKTTHYRLKGRIIAHAKLATVIHKGDALN